MEPFENMDQEQQPTPESPVQESPVQESPVQEPAASTYHAAGTGRKESPYANSPYVMNQVPRQEPQPKPVKKERRPVWKPLLSWCLVLLLVAGGCLTTAYCVNASWEARSQQQTQMLMKKIDDLQKQVNQTTNSFAARPDGGPALTPSQLYAANVSSVVAITTTYQTNSYYGSSTGTSGGSGFILTEDGYVITNYHVVEGASVIEVNTADDEVYPAEVVGYDATNDLAVLKVEAQGLPAATLGSSTNLAIGDMVVAIGNPLGRLNSTQTVGYISGIDREVSTGNLTTISMLQTDASINPGNSGGPLFNMYGEVIGITTAKYSGTTGSGATIEGIGFAIPIDDVVPLIDDLIDYGYVTGAYMGVTVQDTDPESASMFGLPTGAYIVTVEEGGAADRAGIQPKDIVIALDDYKVGNVTELTRALRNYKAGDTAVVTLIRSGRELQLDIVLDEKRPQTESAPAAQEEPAATPDPYGSFDDIFDYFRRYFG